LGGKKGNAHEGSQEGRTLETVRRPENGEVLE